MSELLLPGTLAYSVAIFDALDDPDARENALDTIFSLWHALRLLHAANAQGPCPICPSAEAWESEELRMIREAIEEEA